jgi:NDP-sugar pyrophosphorylase family protein
MPKPLVPVGDKPILEIVLLQLAKQGFTHVNIAVNHQAELIEAYCRDGEKYGLQIRYFLEDKPLSTMGPLKNMDNLPDDFIVMNGDVLSDIPYAAFLNDHIRNHASFTISSFEREQKIDYGVLDISAGRLQEFQEKPHVKYDVSMGIYAMNHSILSYIPKDTFFGFDDLMHRLLDEKVPVHVQKYSGYWMDIGRPEDYEQAVDDVEKRKFIY